MVKITITLTFSKYGWFDNVKEVTMLYVSQEAYVSTWYKVWFALEYVIETDECLNLYKIYFKKVIKQANVIMLTFVWYLYSWLIITLNKRHTSLHQRYIVVEKLYQLKWIKFNKWSAEYVGFFNHKPKQDKHAVRTTGPHTFGCGVWLTF